jgi:hypothetical protein
MIHGPLVRLQAGAEAPAIVALGNVIAMLAAGALLAGAEAPADIQNQQRNRYPVSRRRALHR